jgi:hypothetical protein
MGTGRAQLKYTHLNAAIPQNECGASERAPFKGMCVCNTVANWHDRAHFFAVAVGLKTIATRGAC